MRKFLHRGAFFLKVIRSLLGVAAGVFVAATVWDITYPDFYFNTFERLVGLCIVAVGFSYAVVNLFEWSIFQIEKGKLFEPRRSAMPDSKIIVSYTSSLKLALYPRCVLRFENLKDEFVLDAPGKTIDVIIPEDAPLASEGIRIAFWIHFDSKKRPVAALARAWQPNSIHLELTENRRMVGTIQGAKLASLSAGAVEHDCDVTCIPPAEQEKAVGRCVVCTDEDGVFELCC